jgi:hypothetical protein
MMEPIYALMVTGKFRERYRMALWSLRSFERQSYENKHLIVINDGPSYLNRGSVREFKKNVHEIALHSPNGVPAKLTLGDLRNIALAHVPSGGIWMQWDDDDWHHEDAMKLQYEQMRSTAADICYLKSQIQLLASENRMWIRDREEGIPGTIMARRFPDMFYPPIARNEDTEFSHANSHRRVTVFDNPPTHYIRLIHGMNTWEKQHFLDENILKGKPTESDEGYVNRAMLMMNRRMIP